MGPQPRRRRFLRPQGELPHVRTRQLQQRSSRGMAADRVCFVCRSTFRSKTPLGDTISAPQYSWISSSPSASIWPTSGTSSAAFRPFTSDCRGCEASFLYASPKKSLQSFTLFVIFGNVEPILIRLNSPKSSSELLLSLWRQKLSDHSSSTSDSDVLFFRLFQHRNAELIHNSTRSFLQGFFFSFLKVLSSWLFAL